MNIPLKKRYLDWIAEQVSAGRYASEIEAVEDALAAKIEEEEKQYFREKLRKAEEDVREGRTVPMDDAFFDRLGARIEEVAARKKA
jgi:Arc/MetJ-type ribon-helix-helix transcriptional regulator